LKVFVIGTGNPIPSFIHRRLHALNERGVEVVVSMEYGQKHQLHPAIEIVRYGDVRQMKVNDALHYLGKLLSSPHIFFRLWKLNAVPGWSARLKTTIKYFPLAVVPGVSLIHIQWLTLITRVNWLGALYNVPVMASVRGSQVTVYPRTRAGFSDVVRQAISQTDALHVVSKDLMPTCIDLGARPAQLLVNYNGVNLEKFRPPVGQQPTQTLTLISVGAAIWRKGYLFQLEILKQLMDFTPVSLTIVGEGPDLEGLKYLAFKMGVYKAVQFYGRANEEQVVALLQQSDVYISTSAAEGLANSCMEAAACGLPVVTFACEGMNELVEHGHTGYIVPYGDVAIFVDHVRTLADSKHRLALGKQARQKMEREWSMDFWTDEMIKHYEVISQSTPKLNE
jgi:glycosyltransferase involved in cell wall biosynthesis